MNSGSRRPRLQAPPRQSVRRLLSDLILRPWLTIDARHYLDEYETTQWASEERLRALTGAALRRMVWHCFLEVPYYRLKIGERLRPHQIEKLEDITLLPIASAADRSATPEAFRSVIFDDEAEARKAAIRMRAQAWANGPGANDWVEHGDLGLIASRCERGGLHVHADHLILEVVDPNGRTVPPGERGRILVTDLHNRVAPFLRYEIGDEGRILPEPCACGRALPLVEVFGHTPKT